MSTAQAIKAQAAHQDTLLSKSNVVGVGVGFKNAKGATTGELSVVVLVEQKKPLAALSAEDVIPKEIEGMRTDVYEVGFLRAYQLPDPPLPPDPFQPPGNQPPPGSPTPPTLPLQPPNLPEADPRGRFRPIIPDGVSIGHYKVTAGTLGTMVKDRATGDRLILSNNHVLANGNEAQIGDAILQPGAIDGGEMPSDVVAQLERFIPLRFVDDPVTSPNPPTPIPPNPPMPPTNPTNPPLDPNQPPTNPPTGPTNPTNPPPPLPYPDSGGVKPSPQGCASLLGIVAGIVNFVAKVSGAATRMSVTPAASAASTSALNAPVGPRSFPASTANIGAGALVPENRVDCALARPTNPDMFSDEIPHIGIISETKAPTLGMKVRKYGRTSGYTEGTITLLNATVNVGYSTSTGPRTARLVGQVITEPLSQGGDSGSLICDATENKAVGLLFAGSDLATIFTPIDTVLSALNITL